jgi:hypothetical protein
VVKVAVEAIAVQSAGSVKAGAAGSGDFDGADALGEAAGSLL